ncbi:hypothetical protein [Pseudomonas pharyngis]|uniref:hypothetical protein n=1 Tax=Pseudomonas pharyngis TaxID=2892333 RepID=UPI001F369874|nr:hypothetical protein [Pseudomonas pharyngis]
MGGDAGLKAVSVVRIDEALMNRLEDLELIALCKERENDPTIKVSIDDLRARFSEINAAPESITRAPTGNLLPALL